MGIRAVENARRTYNTGANDPASLRQRMVDRGDDDPLLLMLRDLDADELQEALQEFSDAEVRYLSDLLE